MIPLDRGRGRLYLSGQSLLGGVCTVQYLLHIGSAGGVYKRIMTWNRIQRRAVSD
jgi:hypothetical protein